MLQFAQPMSLCFVNLCASQWSRATARLRLEGQEASSKTAGWPHLQEFLCSFLPLTSNTSLVAFPFRNCCFQFLVPWRKWGSMTQSNFLHFLFPAFALDIPTFGPNQSTQSSNRSMTNSIFNGWECPCLTTYSPTLEKSFKEIHLGNSQLGQHPKILNICPAIAELAETVSVATTTCAGIQQQSAKPNATTQETCT